MIYDLYTPSTIKQLKALTELASNDITQLQQDVSSNNTSLISLEGTVNTLGILINELDNKITLVDITDCTQLNTSTNKLDLTIHTSPNYIGSVDKTLIDVTLPDSSVISREFIGSYQGLELLDLPSEEQVTLSINVISGTYKSDVYTSTITTKVNYIGVFTASIPLDPNNKVDSTVDNDISVNTLPDIIGVSGGLDKLVFSIVDNTGTEVFNSEVIDLTVVPVKATVVSNTLNTTSTYTMKVKAIKGDLVKEFSSTIETA